MKRKAKYVTIKKISQRPRKTVRNEKQKRHDTKKRQNDNNKSFPIQLYAI